jgi:hypothetical protein
LQSFCTVQNFGATTNQIKRPAEEKIALYIYSLYHALREPKTYFFLSFDSGGERILDLKARRAQDTNLGNANGKEIGG